MASVGGRRFIDWRSLGSRLGRALRWDRTAGYSMIGIVAALIVAVVGFGAQGHTVLAHISGVGAWLSNNKQGSVTHANGLSGKADARLMLHNAQGHPLKVIQDGKVVLVQDTVTGVVSRIDPSALTVSQSVSYGAAGVQIVAGAGLAYAIDPVKGVVQRIDPTQLSAIGTSIPLGGPVGTAALDGQGTLWVPLPKTGQVVPVANGTAGTPVSVGRPNDTLNVTVAAGTPVVSDATQATMTVLSRDGGRSTVNLPATATGSASGGLLTPAATDSPLVPVVADGSGQLVVVNTVTATPTSVTLTGLDAHHLGTPQVLGDRVYVPDETTGRLIVYDTGAGQLVDQITVTGKAGALNMFVKDGMLWVNDANGPDAVSVDSSGGVHHIGKYDSQLPGGPLPATRKASSPPPSPKDNGNQALNSGISPAAPGITLGNNNRGNGGGGNRQPAKPVRHSPSPVVPSNPPPSQPSTPPASHPPSSAPPPPPPPVLQAPRSVSETPQNGSILVTFTPDSYTLSGLPSGATSNPTQVVPGSSYRFTVTGLVCGKQPYQFSVVANYPTGQRSTQASGGALPCVAPKAPTNVSLNTGTQHQIGVTWGAPSDNGGGNVTYQVSGAGSGSANGTSYTIRGLKNFQNYSVTVAAVNSAGSSQPPATTSATLAPGRTWGGTIYNNAQYPVNVRAQPDTGSTSKGTFAAGGGQGVTVVCRTPGGSWQDPTGSPSGSTWYKIQYSGDGYVATGYVNTSAAVWDC
jgi:hypothetical protein